MVAMLSQSLEHGAVDYDPFAEGELARVVPTTEPQREVWLADRLGSDASLAFNESVSLRLKGHLDADALQAALQALVDRHDALRASFGPDGETLCVRAALDLNVQLHDLTELDIAARNAAMAERLRLAVDTPFALERDPLLRAELVRLAEDDHRLILTAHHIVCDGWSWWVLVRELAALYAQYCGAGVAALPEADSFADYALAEARHPGGPGFAADEAYWLDRFAAGAPVLDLPFDRPRPQRRSFASRREDYSLDADLVAQLRGMGARRGASLFATLLAGFAATLSRLAGQSQVVVGIPVAGQSVDGHDHLVGHCVNTLPLLFDPDPLQPAGKAVEEAQATLLDAIEHQRYTFGTLLRKLSVPRDPARLPLISVLFNIDQALDHESAAFPGLGLEFRTNPRRYENFELFINAVQEHGALRLECQYNTDLFDAATVRRWLGAYETLLRALAAHAEQPLGAMPVVAGDAFAGLQALQPEPVPFPRDTPLHVLFERQCRATPDRVAVRCGDASMDYAQLDARANRIAHLLRGKGVHRGALVGLAVDRGIDMLASLLGILKSGAGYVPLDPGFPPERLAYMAGDAGLAALVTQRKHAAQFDLRGRPVLALEDIESQLADAPSHALADDGAAADGEAVAYVIYTSGSTGRPKGVQVPHRAVVNFLASMRREPGMAADDVLVAVTTLSFDIAVLELFLPLTTGAQVVLADRDTAMDGVALASLLERSEATVMQATPATWRMLLDTGWRGRAEFRALCGGEPLPAELAERLLPRCAQLWNLYGPTETTVWSTCARVLPASDGKPLDIHIGKPIDNTTVWILDVSGGLCPLGVPGEICIGGDGVTLGYLDRPELTADRFIADRFSSRVEASATHADAGLLYRTGDRGRWRSDGNLQHLGRLDFQVKVRGYRIELGEIESLLAAHQDVAHAVAMAREDRPGDVRLVAYVVPAAGARMDEAGLIAHLRSTLPDYMIPQHLVSLAQLPRLPNGKLDRNALPAPDPGSVASATAFEAPRNALETQVATAMADVLGLEKVGIQDDFFALGGHSLLAAKLTTRLSRDLGASLSLRTLFDAPTVAGLAGLLDGQGGATAAPRVRIPRRDDQRRAPLSLVQERLRQIEHYNPGTLSYNTPSGHRLVGPLDVAKLEAAIRQLAQRQAVLRTSIAVEDGEPLQVVHDDVDPGLGQVIDLSYLPREQREAELALRMHELIQRPFADLSQPPLFVARLYKLGDEEHALFFMPHHIIWDGWSFDLMYADLSELYAALVEGRQAQLPELTVSYGDYAAWHREWVKGPEYAKQIAFWRERLASPNAEGGRPQPLPTDKPRKRGMSGSSQSCALDVSGELTRALHKASRELDVTVFVTLLSAYYVLLAHSAGQRDMLVGTPVRGRNVAEVEGLMGYFTGLLPLRVQVDPGQSFPELVRAVRSVVLDSFAAPDIRLEDLTRELNLRGDGGGSMMYQALFSYQDIRDRPTRWGDIAHSRIEVVQPGATEDLGLWFVETQRGLVGNLGYNADILEQASIQRLRDRYLRLLEAIAADPAQGIDALAATCEQADRRSEAAEAVDAVPDATAAGAVVTPLPVADAGDADRNAGDPRERYLLGLWKELLGGQVAPTDNFFDLGGNSMLAIQMAERVEKETGYRIKLMRLAVQSAAQIAADLPRLDPGAQAQGLGGRLMRGMRRLFGG